MSIQSQCINIHSVEDLENALRDIQAQPRLQLGEILLEEGVIDRAQLEEALENQRAEPYKHIGHILIELGFIDQSQVNLALGRKFGIPVVKMDEFEVSSHVLEMVPADVALQYNVLPLAETGGTLILAMENPLDWEARDIIRFHANRNVEAVIASATDISQTLGHYYSSHEAMVMGDDETELNPIVEEDIAPTTVLAEKQAMQKPVVRLLNALMLQAVVRGASDINIRPEKDRVNVFYRIDGKLQFVRSLSRSLLLPVVTRVKVIARMDVAEHHLPQDGHARLMRGENHIDLRISVIPTITGESAVIRILDKEIGLKPLANIGFHERELGQLRQLIEKSFGMFLVTGPTGSGKSTTLYAVLNEVKKKGPHIITVEDPVEYDMQGVEQIQVLKARGYDFAQALRHILRHDPDVIMIGEIRDQETVHIANKAALTGHLVLSTLHTNDAASAVTRLMDMGVEPYLLSTTLLGTMAQRLIRLNCPKCLVEEKIEAVVRHELGVAREEPFYNGDGCPSCDYTGYHGRIAVCELLVVTPEIRKLISLGRDAQEIKALAIEQGMVTLTSNALALAREKKTSLAEVYATRLD